jgi:hypothetical protein
VSHGLVARPESERRRVAPDDGTLGDLAASPEERERVARAVLAPVDAQGLLPS